MEWGAPIESIPGFHIDSETLKVIQDFLYSGFHVLLSGNPGCGKTEFGQAWARCSGLRCHIVNCGAIRNPRDWFGRWEYREGKGTVFVPSRFVETIQQPGLVILDEINRTTPDNHNPIMNILDGNREVYVEELNGCVRVHDHALFLATCNTGRQHTGTFHLDHALADRFQEIRLQLPPQDVIAGLLLAKYAIPPEQADTVARITVKLNELYEGDMLGKTIGMRPALAAAALLAKGNPLPTALKYAFVSRYSGDGGPESEQTLILQTIQGLVDVHVLA